MVEVVFFPEEGPVFQYNKTYSAPQTVEEVLFDSGLFQKHPETRHYAVGIFSQRVLGSAYVSDGDRIEIYRPLHRDPKVRRRQQALLQKRNQHGPYSA